MTGAVTAAEFMAHAPAPVNANTAVPATSQRVHPATSAGAPPAAGETPAGGDDGPAAGSAARSLTRAAANGACACKTM